MSTVTPNTYTPEFIAKMAWENDWILSQHPMELQRLCQQYRWKHNQPSKLNPSVPRRAMVPEWTEAEHAISRAVELVELVGAHPLLTDAVVLLGRAKDKVADYQDYLKCVEDAKKETQSPGTQVPS